MILIADMSAIAYLTQKEQKFMEDSVTTLLA
jgi:hypothetical protein